MPTALDLLRSYSPGDRLRAEDVNALIQHAKQQVQIDGFSDSTVLAERHKATARSVMHCINNTGAALEPYSLFSIADKRTGDGGTETNIDIPRGLATIAGVDPNGSPLLFLTNGLLEVPKDAEFQPEMIGFDVPIKVKASLTSPPEVGEQCGIELDTKTATYYRYGLVCLAPSWMESGVRYTWVCRSREPIKIIGCVTSKILKSQLVDGTRQVGEGTIQVLYRDSNNSLKQVKRPSDTLSQWFLTIYNYTEIEYNVGMIVSVTDTLGIGLTVNNEVVNSLCQMSSMSSSSGP